MRQEIIEAAIDRAAVRLNPSTELAQATSLRVRRELDAVEGELERLTAAIASGGDLPALLRAVQEREERRRRLRAELASANRPGLDPAALKANLKARLADWRGLLTRHIPQARPYLSRSHRLLEP